MLQDIFPYITNIKNEGDYIFVGYKHIKQLNQDSIARNEFLQRFSFYTIANICNNYIFFTSKNAAIKFINKQSGWWDYKTKFILLYEIKDNNQFIDDNQYVYKISIK